MFVMEPSVPLKYSVAPVSQSSEVSRALMELSDSVSFTLSVADLKLPAISCGESVFAAIATLRKDNTQTE